MRVLLADRDGLYTADPHKDPTAQRINEVPAITPEILALGGACGSSLGTGGMRTKLHAAELVTAAGTDMVIANGSAPQLLYDIAAGRRAGTRFLGRKDL